MKNLKMKNIFINFLLKIKKRNLFEILKIPYLLNILICFVAFIFIAYNCTKDDYKLWSPTSSKDHLKTSCVLGRTQIFQRKSPKANCYSGIMNYERPIQTVTCDCDIEDYTW